jgi:5-methylcytosine-specific restriction endonuclease McrA
VYSVALVRDQKAAPAADAEPATLDHIICRSSGKANHHESNIVTCCLSCNSQRQDKPVRVFARIIETKNNPANEIVKRVTKLRRRKLPRLEDLNI